jgi:hypothetical protein
MSTAQANSPQINARPPLAPSMRSFVRLVSAPIIIVTLATLLPLLLYVVYLPGSLHFALNVHANVFVYAFAFECTFAFIAAFALLAYRTTPAEPESVLTRRTVKKLRRRIALYSVLLCIVGLYIVYLILMSGVAGRLIQLLLSGKSDADLRLEIIANESIPGIVRMLGYLVLGSLVLFLGAVLARHDAMKKWKGFWPLLLFLILAVIARGLVFMDRVPTFGAGALVLLVLAQRMHVRPRVILPYAVAGLAMLFVVGGLARQQAGLRGGVLTESNPVLLYADLGMANTALAIESTTKFSYGFNSLLMPLLFVPRGIGLGDVKGPVSNQAWVWDPASNLLAHAFTDFGPFGFITYLIWGAAVGFIWKRHVQKKGSITWAVAYLWSILAVLVIWTQPLTGGPDYWAAVIITIVAARSLDGITRRTA